MSNELTLIIATISSLAVILLALAAAKHPKTPHPQSCFCYCPECKNELCGSDSYVCENGDVVTYQCTGCGRVSQWHFGTPVPILLEGDGEDEQRD